jgi:plastocyanin
MNPASVILVLPLTDRKGDLMRKTAGTLALVAVLFAAFVIPASARDRGIRSDANTARATVERVKIVDFAFRPRVTDVSRGTRVRWTNRGSVSHTTTSNGGIWDSGSIAPGGTFSRVFRNAGTFRFHCTIHPDMKGKIVVT